MKKGLQRFSATFDFSAEKNVNFFGCWIIDSNRDVEVRNFVLDRIIEPRRELVGVGVHHESVSWIFWSLYYNTSATDNYKTHTYVYNVQIPQKDDRASWL